MVPSRFLQVWKLTAQPGATRAPGDLLRALAERRSTPTAAEPALAEEGGNRRPRRQPANRGEGLAGTRRWARLARGDGPGASRTHPKRMPCQIRNAVPPMMLARA